MEYYYIVLWHFYMFVLLYTMLYSCTMYYYILCYVMSELFQGLLVAPSGNLAPPCKEH